MGKEIASAYVTIGANTNGLKQGLAESKSGLGKLNDSFKSLTGVSLTTAGALGAVYKGLQFVVNEAIESEQATTKLNQVLKSTEGISGMTMESLDGLASSLAKVTVYDDDTIKSAEALMLTFTKIGKEVFPGAMEAALNMSAAFGQDLQSSVVQLGKALNDPSGMAAMKRIGVSFSDAQIKMAKELYETGQVAEYQKLIMSELNTEVGGMARAMGTTYAGQVAIFKNNLGELGEAAGTVLLPALNDVVVLLNDLSAKEKSVTRAAADYVNKVAEGTWAESNYSKELRIKNEAMAESERLFQEGIAVATQNAGTGVEFMATKMGHLAIEAENVNNAISDEGGLSGSLHEATDYFEDLNTQMVFNYLSAKMDKDAQMELARQMGLINEETYSTISSLDELTEKYDINKDGVIDLTEKTGQYDQQLAAIIDKQNQLKDKTVTYTIYTNQITNGGAQTGGSQIKKPGQSQMEAQANGGTFVRGHAAGQSYMLPASVGYEGAYMGAGHTASGSEMVSISNQRQISDMMLGLTNAINLLQRLPDRIARSTRDAVLQG